MLLHRRHLRRWAARVLLAWLFGIASGIANACLLSGPAEAAPAVTQHHHDDEAAGAKAACLDLCDKASVSAPVLKSAPDVMAFSAGPVPAAPAPPALQVAPLRRVAAVADRQGAPPIPIAFLRLTL